MNEHVTGTEVNGAKDDRVNWIAFSFLGKRLVDRKIDK